MRILSVYIGKTIIMTTLLVLLVLIGMDIFIRFVGELNDIGKGSYSIIQAMQYVVLGVPEDLYQLFPMMGLLGALIGLGLLASNSELIVMRTAGMSVLQISWAVIQAILILVILITVVGETLAPKALYLADSKKAMAKSNGQAVKTRHGIWVRDANSFIHIETVNPGGHLQGVTRYQFDSQHRLLQTSHAENAEYKDDHWVVQDVATSRLKNDSHVSTEHAAKQTWQMNLNPSILRVAQVDPEEMTLAKLHSVIQYKKNNGLHYEAYALDFWQRLFQPIATCVMMFLALPFIFGPLRSATMGLRLVAGVAIGFSFYMLDQFFGPFSLVYQIPPMLAAALPILLFAGIGYYLMLRTR